MPDTTGPTFQAANLRGASEEAVRKGGKSNTRAGRKSSRKSKRG